MAGKAGRRATQRRRIAVARAEAALAEVNAHVDRFEATREHEGERHERAYAALAAARRTDVGACHVRIEQLTAALVKFDAPIPELEVPLPAMEFQQGLVLDDDERAGPPEEPWRPTS